jgi:hypothetical protein
MDENLLNSICNQVYKKFPEVNGIRPKLQAMSKGTTSQHILIFSGKAKTASGTSIARVVRVVVSSEGKIIKMSTSK